MDKRTGFEIVMGLTGFSGAAYLFPQTLGATFSGVSLLAGALLLFTLGLVLSAGSFQSLQQRVAWVILSSLFSLGTLVMLFSVATFIKKIPSYTNLNILMLGVGGFLLGVVAAVARKTLYGKWAT